MFNALFDTYFPLDTIRKISPVLRPDIHLCMFIREMELFRFKDLELGAILKQEVVFPSPRKEVIQSRRNITWGVLDQLLELGRNEGYFHFRSLDRTKAFIIGTLLSVPGLAGLQQTPEMELDEQEQELIIEDLQVYIFGALRCPLPENMH